MSISLNSVYHRLPYPLRMITASAHGYYLSYWRYNFDTNKLVAEALERETWGSDRWLTWQQERLAYILHRAATQVPFYKQYWNKRRRYRDHASWEILNNWPILTKETLRAQPHAFVAEDCNPRRMFEGHTSGTTGKPLTLWYSRQTVMRWYALWEARIRIWNGVSRHDKWAILGGQLVTPISQGKPPYWVWNQGLKQLYLSSYHLAPANIHDYIKALQKHNITYIFGYASSIESLALLAKEQNIPIPFQIKVAISNAEPLYPYQRKIISEIFRCDVRNTYGMAEMVATASECKNGKLHLWPEAGIVEITEFDSIDSYSMNGNGRFICTGLFNPDMLLIRYEVGDYGSINQIKTECKCGRKLPILEHIDGRNDDVLITSDGRRIGRLDPVFKANLAIREAQIIQESPTHLRLRYIPATGFTDKDEQAIKKSLQQRVGNIEITMESVQNIPRGPNGKFRAVISQTITSE